jgi:hypothetical protein
VDFVVVGVGGINFYARTPGEIFATVDLDALLPPAVENLVAGLRVLSGLGHAFEAGEEPFPDLEDGEVPGFEPPRAHQSRSLVSQAGLARWMEAARLRGRVADG